jgi:hypothetical protein
MVATSKLPVAILAPPQDLSPRHCQDKDLYNGQDRAHIALRCKPLLSLQCRTPMSHAL